jgi:hypothetical protein
MSRFTDATWEDTGRLNDRGRPVYRLTSPLAYEIGFLGSGWVIEAPAGFETDLASVPTWLLRRSWGRRTAERFALPSVVHDQARSDPRMPKLLGDYVFFEAAGVLGISIALRLIAYAGVLLNFSRH